MGYHLGRSPCPLAALVAFHSQSKAWRGGATGHSRAIRFHRCATANTSRVDLPERRKAIWFAIGLTRVCIYIPMGMGGGLGGLGGKGAGKGVVANVARDVARLSRDCLCLPLRSHALTVCRPFAFCCRIYVILNNSSDWSDRLGVIIQPSDKFRQLIRPKAKAEQIGHRVSTDEHLGGHLLVICLLRRLHAGAVLANSMQNGRVVTASKKSADLRQA